MTRRHISEAMRIAPLLTVLAATLLAVIVLAAGCTPATRPVAESAVGACGGPVDAIASVQGTGAASPRAGERVTVRGVVVGDFQELSELGGFFLQDPRATEIRRVSRFLLSFSPQLPSRQNEVSSATIGISGKAAVSSSFIEACTKKSAGVTGEPSVL